MNAHTPQICVGMPVFNGEAYLAEAIRSVLGQTHEDFVLIISDNASTDGTESICRRFCSEDSRIIYTRNLENIGAAANYNKLFRLCYSPYFRWFNADDISAPELHARCLEALEDNPDAALCYGRTAIIDEAGSVIDLYDDRLDLQQARPADRFIEFFKRVGFTNAIYGLMRRSAVAKTSLMGNGGAPSTDVRLMAELTLYGTFISLPLTLFQRRMHAGAMSAQKDDDEAVRVFWSARRQRYRLPTWRTHWEYIHAVSTGAIPLKDKLQLVGYLLRRMRWERAELIGDLREECRLQFRRCLGAL